VSAGVPAAMPGAASVRVAALPATLDQAREHLLDGDYQKATAAFASVALAQPGTPQAAEAALRLGEASLADDRFLAAAGHLRAYLTAFPNDSGRATALLLLGRAQEGAGDGGAAVAAYQQFGAVTGDAAFLGDVLHLRAATIFFNAGRVADAWAELSAAVRAADQSGSASAKIRTYDALGGRYREAGNWSQAAAAWEVALDATVQAKRPARETAEMAWKLVGAYEVVGRRDLADALRWRIVGEWPKTFTAWQAMNDLGPDGLPSLLRGQIAFTNQRWAQAAAAFSAYLDAGAPEGKADEARYSRAVALASAGDDAALDALDAVPALHPDSPWAPEALWQAGNLLLRQGNTAAALARFEQLAVGFPASPRRGQALYWLGKLLPEQGNVAAGHRYMAAAADAPYEDYYTFRARAALQRPAPAPRPLAGQEEITEDDRRAWERWLSDRGVPSQVQAERRAQVAADARYRRGLALLDGGFKSEAGQELRELLDAWNNDPVVVEHVAVQVRDRGAYALSAALGQRLADGVAGMGEPALLDAPRVVQKLVLPLAFFSLVASAAQTERIDPLLLLGMIKQESGFEPRATSSAAARGLTQFVYDTANSVATELQWPDWQWDDMNKPYVSIPFGAHYLAGLMQRFGGNQYFALAGYNGGPGNVLRWAKNDWNRDVDTFVEEIGFAETRNYVKAVIGNYELYKAVYYA
jgi:soluble lytic murein transglycosylase